MMLGLCVYLQFGCLTFFFAKKLQQWQKGPRGIWLSFPPSPPSYHAYPYHLSSSPSSPPHHHHPPSFPLHSPSSSTSGCFEGLQALPPLLQGPVGQALGCLRTGLASSPPWIQNNDSFEIYHKLQNCDKYNKTLIFRCLSSWQNLKN